jgi:hypothetical protein
MPVVAALAELYAALLPAAVQCQHLNNISYLTTPANLAKSTAHLLSDANSCYQRNHVQL